MDYRILGPVEVVTAEGPRVLGGPKQRALLGVLLLHADRVVSTDRLVTSLWGEDAPETALNILQGHVGDLRRLLERDALLTRPPGYLLRVDPGAIDSQRFERLAQEGRRRLTSDPATAAARLREALALWRGPVLADVAYGCPPSEITRLEELRLATLEDRVDADLAGGGHPGMVGELEALLADHPGRERLCGQLMLALYRSGRQSEALAAYRELRRRLADELGIDPSPDLQRLERSILRQEPSLLLPSPAAGPSVAPVPTLPVGGPPPTAAPPRPRRPPWVLLAAAAAVALSVSSVGLLRWRSEVPPPTACARRTPPPPPRSLGPGEGVFAAVAHTCDPNGTQGIFSHSGPVTDPATRVQAYDEGAFIRVVCQDRHGSRVSDQPYQGRQASSTVWDRLTVGDWISDIYTTLPKQPGDTPPLGLPTC